VVMNGNRPGIQASVDLDGLKKLQAMLEKYQGILEMMQPDAKDKDDVFKRKRPPTEAACFLFFDPENGDPSDAPCYFLFLLEQPSLSVAP
jgi:hypothetical protein